MDKEKFKEIWEEGKLESLERDSDDSWRHGSYIYQVFEYKEMGTYWAVYYPLSSDGEYHGIKEDDFELYQVKPVKKIVETIEYVSVKET